MGTGDGGFIGTLNMNVLRRIATEGKFITMPDSLSFFSSAGSGDGDVDVDAGSGVEDAESTGFNSGDVWVDGLGDTDDDILDGLDGAGLVGVNTTGFGDVDTMGAAGATFVEVV